MIDAGLRMRVDETELDVGLKRAQRKVMHRQSRAFRGVLRQWTTKPWKKYGSAWGVRLTAIPASYNVALPVAFDKNGDLMESMRPPVVKVQRVPGPVPRSAGTFGHGIKGTWRPILRGAFRDVAVRHSDSGMPLYRCYQAIYANGVLETGYLSRSSYFAKGVKNSPPALLPLAHTVDAMALLASWVLRVRGGLTYQSWSARGMRGHDYIIEAEIVACGTRKGRATAMIKLPENAAVALRAGSCRFPRYLIEDSRLTPVEVPDSRLLEQFETDLHHYAGQMPERNGRFEVQAR